MFRRRYNSLLIEKPGDPLLGGMIWMRYLITFFTMRVIRFSHAINKDSLQLVMSCVANEDKLAIGNGFNILNDWRNKRNSDNSSFEFSDEESDSEEQARKPLKLFKKMSTNDKRRFETNLLEVLEERVEKLLVKSSKTDIFQKFQKLESVLEMTKAESHLTQLLMAMDYSIILDRLIDDELNAFHVINRSLICAILDITSKEFNRVLRGKLVVMELIDDNYNSVPRLNSSFFDLLDSQGDIEHLKNLIPVGEPKLTPCDFFVNSKTFNLLKGLFQSESLAPTHVLLYGPSGVGKTQFARTLAKEVDNLAYEVPVKDSENTRSTHRINVILAGAIARRFNNAMLIIDEADDLLNTDNYGLSMLFGGLLKESMEGKSWLDDFMDKPGLKCLWIVNNHKRLPESVIRRFTFSLSFPNLGSKERLAIWRTSQKELVDLGSEVLSNAAIEKFANNAKVSPGVINQTFRKGLEAGATDEDTLISYVDKMIDAHRKLSKARLTTHVLADSYRPNCVNISPSVGTILDILQNLVANNRELSEISSQGLKFLFYGPSGTGKTELAQFLANTLNLELVHGRLSNILSPYVGESENELANMFDRAQAIGGLLLFDEVESFLSIRERSVNQHMTLLTNEFLVCLERFKGIFIGSTNRFSSLDPAAIRRFTFKVEFKPLGPEGRIELFDSYFQTLTGSSVNESEKKYLLSLPSITPGDYSVVADKVKWLQKDSFDNFYILENLALEASFRDSRATQNSSGLLEDKESPDKKDEGSNDPPKSIN